MITPPPAQNTNFNENYDILGEYASDDQRIPYFNPPNSNRMIEPGEPVLIQWNGAEEVMQAQGPIRPGQIGYLVRYFVADLPANLSANVVLGDSLTWDVDNKRVSLDADVTNGFVIGNATWAVDPHIKNQNPTTDGNGRVVCGGTASTKVRVLHAPGPVTTKGTVTIL